MEENGSISLGTVLHLPEVEEEGEGSRELTHFPPKEREANPPMARGAGEGRKKEKSVEEKQTKTILKWEKEVVK